MEEEIKPLVAKTKKKVVKEELIESPFLGHWRSEQFACKDCFIVAVIDRASTYYWEWDRHRQEIADSLLEQGENARCFRCETALSEKAKAKILSRIEERKQHRDRAHKKLCILLDEILPQFGEHGARGSKYYKYLIAITKNIKYKKWLAEKKKDVE
jgi:hypothetical protein